MPLWVGSIVEGDGEVEAVPVLLRRIWNEMLGGDYIEILPPDRKRRDRLLQGPDLKKAVGEVKIRLDDRAPDGTPKLVLILIDSEGECPGKLAPRLLAWAREARADADIACVLPHPMFETWFAAAAASLSGVKGLPATLAEPDDPEGKRLGKGWVKRHLPTYSETVDQPRFAARIDPARCRERSASFDKLCRELERRLPQAPTG